MRINLTGASRLALLAGVALSMTEATGAAAGDTQAPAPTTSTITIQGISFEVDRPYNAGNHVLTAGEANALNQTRAENLRNNFAGKIKAAQAEYRKANNLAEDAEVPVDGLDVEGLRAQFDEAAAAYEFSERQGGGGARTPKDPVLAEAYRIAWDKIKAVLTQRSIKLNTISDEKKTELIESAIEKYPDIKAEAERRVSAVGEIALDGITG